MSWDQQAFSFGSSVAQPPTPTRTPTTAQFPSPLLQTPGNNRSSFEDRSGWTPTFAEEYSVFNSTPGRLTNNHPAFAETTSPLPHPTLQQSQAFSESGPPSAALTPHTISFSPNPSGALSPVDRLSELPFPPDPNASQFGDLGGKVTPRKPPKRLDASASGQTVTPPATASKGSRKLAPKVSTEAMQDSTHSRHLGDTNTPGNHSNLLSFSSTPGDLFNYPMSAPATAPTFNPKPFWDSDATMAGMDLDFSTEDNNLFTSSSHRPSNSYDWGKSNDAFQATFNSSLTEPLAMQVQNQVPATAIKDVPKQPRALAPRPAETWDPDGQKQKSFVYPNPSSESVFDIDPGLLYGRSTMMAAAPRDGDHARQISNSSKLQPYSQQLRESMRDRKEEEEQRETRRSRSMKDSMQRLERVVSSPVKGSIRPGLHRSMSDGRGKMSPDRVLPRNGGRISPSKRYSGLKSIPESRLKLRTEVKFVIDDNGRARTETVVVNDGLDTVSDNNLSAQDLSSSDDEDIIIHSRSTSFTIPRSKSQHVSQMDPSIWNSNAANHYPRHQSYSLSESSRSSQISLRRSSLDSEAETVLEDDGTGDATRAIRKLVGNRTTIESKNSDLTPVARSLTDPRAHSQHPRNSSSSHFSPTIATDDATPSSTRSGVTRCVCSDPSTEGFMIQCESCDGWLHGKCVGIDRRSLPPVYICAFCALTPQKRRGRIRDPARGNGDGSSPLAHKSFQSFR